MERAQDLIHLEAGIIPCLVAKCVGLMMALTSGWHLVGAQVCLGNGELSKEH